jgi:hypothetical protein
MKITYLIKKIRQRITFFDLVFIILAMSLLFGFYFFFRREVVTITARFKVTDENVLYAETAPKDEFANSFKVGDTEYDGLGRVVSKIVNVESYKIVPDRTITYIDIRLQAVYNPRTRLYAVRGKNIIFGETFDFSFTKVKFKGLVVDFPHYKDPNTIIHKKIIVKAQLRNDSRFFSEVYGVPDFLAVAVKQGDEVKNSKGNVLARIVDVNSMPAKRLVTNNTGQPYFVDDPYLKDVYYTIELATTEENGTMYMFGYVPVVIGAQMPINTAKTSIFPIITEIIE